MPSRKRQFVRGMKWASAGCCSLLLLAWALSLRYELLYVRPGTSWSFYVRAACGQIGVFSQAQPFWPAVDYSWRFRSIEFAPDWAWDVGIVGPRTWVVILPFWMILLATGGLTLLAWWPRRRRGPGQCRRCGYDLTGNASGVCPECGSSL